MRQLFGFLFFLSISSIIVAQPSGGQGRQGGASLILKGKVIDQETEGPLEYATISIFQKRDGNLVNGDITNVNGEFSIKLRPGVYDVKFEFLGYDESLVEAIKLSPENPVKDLGKITMAFQAAALDEVVVTEERSTLQMGLDKKIFNVGKDLSSKGGSAADVLDNVPSVQVDVEGNVSLRGSQNVRILIDGKPTGLIGNGTNGLRAIQSNMIEKIEVITNPSARYAAEGMAGIINIVLKKNQAKGFNGAFEATVGWPRNTGLSANINYRANKFNFFLNYGVSYRKGPGGGYNDISLIKPDTTFLTRQNTDRTRGGLSNNIRFGADYSVNKQNTITTAFNLRLGDENNFSSSEYLDYINNFDNFINRTIRTDNETEDESRLEYSLTHKKTFDRKGQKWTTDIRYQDNIESEGSELVNTYYNLDGSLSGRPQDFQRSGNDERSNQLTISSDFVLPFSKESKFEVGGRASIRNIDNDYAVEELNDNVWTELPEFTDQFEYDENIYAAYLIYGNKVNKFSFQIGLRPEYTDVTTTTSDSVNARDYLNVFPSGHIGYELSNNSNIQLSYSRRVRRPRFWDLNPFFTFSDDRNFFSGNPDLNPEFTDAYELGHVKYWDKASLSSAIYYRHTTDKIQRNTRVDSLGNYRTKPENLATEDAFGLEFNVSLSPIKWFKFNSDFNFYRSIIDGQNVDEDFTADTYTWFARGSARFTAWKTTDIQLRFNYRAPRETTQGLAKAIASLDFAASRDIMNDKATLTLSVRDVFNSRRRRYKTEGVNEDGFQFIREGDFQWRARQADLTFSYRLNQKKRRGGRRGGYDGGGGGEF